MGTLNAQAVSTSPDVQSPVPHGTQRRVGKCLLSDNSVVPLLVVMHSLLIFTARALKILSLERKPRPESLKALKNDLYLL